MVTFAILARIKTGEGARSETEEGREEGLAKLGGQLGPVMEKTPGGGVAAAATVN